MVHHKNTFRSTWMLFMCVSDYYCCCCLLLLLLLLIDWFSGDVLIRYYKFYWHQINSEQHNREKNPLTITSKSVFKMESKFQKRDEMVKNLKKTLKSIWINKMVHTKNRFQHDDFHVAIIYYCGFIFFFSVKFQL